MRNSPCWRRVPSLVTPSWRALAKTQRPAGDGQGEKLYEKALAADRALASQQEALAAVRRQQLLLERRMAEMEDMTVALQGQVTEARRAAGEVALQQQNVELLVEQMEQRVLHMSTVATAAVAGASTVPSLDSNQSTGAEAAATPRSEMRGIAERAPSDKMAASTSEEQRSVQAQGEPQPVPAPPSAASDGSTVARRVAELDRKLAVLQAHVDHLVLHKIDLTHAVTTTTTTAATSAEALEKAADKLANQHRQNLLVTFKDPTGDTRLASQVVAIHNVPANMGSAEVREACVRACGVNGVVSCVVRHDPAPAPAPGGGEATTLPGRVFHVTFDSVHLALRAITALHGLVLKGEAHTKRGTSPRHRDSTTPSPALRVEPVVSADRQAALHGARNVR